MVKLEISVYKFSKDGDGFDENHSAIEYSRWHPSLAAALAAPLPSLHDLNFADAMIGRDNQFSTANTFDPPKVYDPILGLDVYVDEEFPKGMCYFDVYVQVFSRSGRVLHGRCIHSPHYLPGNW